MRECRGTGVFLGLRLRRHVEYVKHAALNYTSGFIVVLMVVRFAAARNVVAQHTEWWCLFCSTGRRKSPILYYMVKHFL